MKLTSIFFIIAVVSSQVILAGENDYDRAQCDKLIGVEKFIVAGSLDNTSAGGKTYNFKKIVEAIENELLGTQDPRPDHFVCYSSLFDKAHKDAEDYWVGRFKNSSCAGEDGTTPSVKPENCDQGTWDEYHRSMNLIERSVASVYKVTQECVERNGRKSCDSMNALKGLQDEVASPVAFSKMDACCETPTKEQPRGGSAYRVLRSFYTIEFGSMNDTDLQKECFKRSRPGSFGDLNIKEDVPECLLSILKGIGESLKKMGTALLSLVDYGTWTEIWKFITTPKEILPKVMAFFSEMFAQGGAHFSSVSECFSPRYKVQHICKLASAMVLDYFVGKKAIDMLLGIIKTPINGMKGLAKKFLDENPNAKKALGDQKDAPQTARSFSSATKRVSSKISTKAKSLARGMGARLNNMRKTRQNIAKGVVEERKKSGNGRSTASEVSGPNGSATVPARQPAPAAPAPTPPTSIAASAPNPISPANIGGTASRAFSGKNMKTGEFKRIMQSLKPFDGDPSRRLRNPENHLSDRRKLKNKTREQKLALIEEGAKRRRAEVDRLENATGSQKISAEKAALMRTNISNALETWKSKNGFASTPSASSRAGSVASASARAVDPTPAPIAKPPNTPDTQPAQGSSPAKSTGDSSPPSNPFTVADNVASPSGLDLGRISSTPASSVVTQASADSVVSFARRVQSAATERGKPTAARTSVFESRNKRGVKRESLQRHHDIERMYKDGLISESEALAFHRMVVTAEIESVGKASKFTTSYIVSPNASPSSFSNLPPPKKTGLLRGTANSLVGSTYGNTLENKLFDATSDQNNSGRYTESTIQESQKVVEKLVSSPFAVRKEFDSLRTETAINDKADDLRAKVKTIEATLGRTVTPEEKEQIEKLLASIKTERDRAVFRIQGKNIDGTDIQVGYEGDEEIPTSSNAKPKPQPRQPAQRPSAPVQPQRPSERPDEAPEKIEYEE